MTLATRTKSNEIIPCPKCGDPMARYPLRGAGFPDFTCGPMCGYEGDGTLPRLLSEEERRNDSISRSRPSHAYDKKTIRGSFFFPPNYWIAKPEDLIEVPYIVLYSERGHPERSKGWQVRLSAIHGIDMEIIHLNIQRLNVGRASSIENPVKYPVGWKTQFKTFLVIQVRELFAIVPDENLKGLNRAVDDIIKKEKKAWF